MIHTIIPVHNRLNKTIKCLNSLERTDVFEDLNIILVNDGSTDGTEEQIKTNYPKVTILNSDGSLFWGGAINLGIEYALNKKKANDWMLIINNDIELEYNTISKLKNISEYNKRKFITIPLTLSSKDKKTIIKSGTIVKSWFFNITNHIFADMKIDEIKDSQPVEVDIFTGRCVLHPIEIFEIVGNYDSLNFKHYCCDDEFSIRIKKYGYKILLCPSSVIYLSENDPLIIKKKLNIQNLFHVFFNIKSSSNIINKLKLTLKVVPMYAKFSFFFIGVLKSLYVFFKKDY